MDHLRLIRRYEPVLVFSTDGKEQPQPEFFFPMTVEHYVAHCALYRKGQEVLPPGQVTLQKLAQLGDDSGDYYLAYATRKALSQIPESAREYPITMSRLEGQMALSARMPRRDANELRRGAPNTLLVSTQDENELQEKVVNTLLEKRPPGGWEIEGKRGVPSLRGWLTDRVPAPPEDEEKEMVNVVFLGEEPGRRGAVGRGGISQLPLQVLQQARENYEPYRDLPPTYYYCVMRDQGYLVLQYWFFYAYNDWGTAHDGWNDHEGDWEGIMIYLRDEDTPAYVAYSKHFRFPSVSFPAPIFFFGPDQAGWGDEKLDKRYQCHPVVYVACGSHASYVEAEPHSVPHDLAPILWDYALGNQRRIGPGQRIQWEEPIDLEQQDWAMSFRGHWGALWRRLLDLGTAGPAGPPYQEHWGEPVKWGLAKQIG